MGPVLAISLVLQTLTEWAELLRRDLEGEKIAPAFCGVGRSVGPGAPVCDAAPLISKPSVSAVVLRRVLRLKCWSADQVS